MSQNRDPPGTWFVINPAPEFFSAQKGESGNIPTSPG